MKYYLCGTAYRFRRKVRGKKAIEMNADTDINENSVTGKNVYRIEKEYIENDPNSIFPLKSRKLNRIEYEAFLNN